MAAKSSKDEKDAAACSTKNEQSITNFDIEDSFTKMSVDGRVETYQLVAAIDFGTMYSGYAYAFRSAPDKTYLNTQWMDGEGHCLSHKTPTCILLDKKKKFHSFGYEAEEKFTKLSQDGNQEQWYFFKEFKMKLHKDGKGKVTRDTMIKEEGGKEANAIDVFAMSVKYMKEKIMSQIKDTIHDLRIEDVKFVLTIPAIWSDEAKQFMREAAEKAGIPSHQLVLALEPEAAAVHCKGELLGRDETGRIGLLKGRYMIVDLGGGTVDITVHETQEDGTLAEMYAASGGPWGGRRVNELFIERFRKFVGRDTFDEFKNMYMEDYLQILRDFEMKKRTIKINDDSPFRVNIPLSLRQMHANASSKTTCGSPGTGLSFKTDKLEIASAVMNTLTCDAIEQILKHVQGILSSKDLNEVNQIILVGGFAACKPLQTKFRETLKKLVIIPPEADMAVLRGAVQFGMNETHITSRILRYTYGVDICTGFDPSIHPEEKLVIQPIFIFPLPLCKDLFHVFGRVGQSVKHNERIAYTLQTLSHFQTTITRKLDLFRSTDPSPKFTTDSSCEQIGTLTLTTQVKPEELLMKDIEISFTFGRTEIKVEAEGYETLLDLLG